MTEQGSVLNRPNGEANGTLGGRLRAARVARRMTQRVLAAGTLSVGFISMLEHDKVRPSLETLETLAQRLRLPLGYFTVTRHPGVELEAAIQEGEGYVRQLHFTEALEVFSTVDGLANESEDVRLRVRYLLGLGRALTGIRQFALAEGHLRRAGELAEVDGSVDLIGATAYELGLWEFGSRRFLEARATAQDGLTRLRAAGTQNPKILGKILLLLGRVYLELGLPAQALEYYQQATEHIERAADPIIQGLLEFNMGIAYRRQQAFGLAQQHLERASNCFAVQENLHLLSAVKRSVGNLQLARGEVEDAIGSLEESLRLARQVCHDDGIAQALFQVARARLKQGLIASARSAAAEALALAARIADPAAKADAEAVLAEVASTEGRLTEAIARFKSAIATFERLSMHSDLARAYRDLGFVYMKQRQAAAAASCFSRVFELRALIVPLREEST